MIDPALDPIEERVATDYTSVFELMRIGIGPSSSHTVGPMRAAQRFVVALEGRSQLCATRRVQCDFYGSLGATGPGHATDRAAMLGLMGEKPASVDPMKTEETLARVERSGSLLLCGRHEVPFCLDRDLAFHPDESLPLHPNGMVFTAYDASGSLIARYECYSVGGGRIEGPELGDGTPTASQGVPHPFRSMKELLRRCDRLRMELPALVMANEAALRGEDRVRAGIRSLWSEMRTCAQRGCHAKGKLPGGLGVRRRAPELARCLQRSERGNPRHLEFLDWVNLWAIAVAEENAAGGRIVTAPTNGAAGILPAVLHYYMKFMQGDEEGVVRFFLTAAAIGSLFLCNASISGAAVGCQGEVGVASSMAAGALAAALGAGAPRIEKAAEIAMEHHLGLTCDPVGGLVQVPCIERNAIGAIKAIEAQRLAAAGSEEHLVSLDSVIETMRQTGRDMKPEYKETSRGGLAVNVKSC